MGWTEGRLGPAHSLRCGHLRDDAMLGAGFRGLVARDEELIQLLGAGLPGQEAVCGVDAQFQDAFRHGEVQVGAQGQEIGRAHV